MGQNKVQAGSTDTRKSSPEPHNPQSSGEQDASQPMYGQATPESTAKARRPIGYGHESSDLTLHRLENVLRRTPTRVESSRASPQDVLRTFNQKKKGLTSRHKGNSLPSRGRNMSLPQTPESPLDTDTDASPALTQDGSPGTGLQEHEPVSRRLWGLRASPSSNQQSRPVFFRLSEFSTGAKIRAGGTRLTARKFAGDPLHPA
jgi:hypothetical protein